ncbi:hypothetical protein VCC_001715 [Vibrio cholerae RC9]|uniref:Uncharacterized protein n=1 Tax=Vibrio cholerae TaxID=666 RepID=A0A655YI18_VIBCL|nr:hypothetical protein VCD_000443 [Vibrio cholerae MJ-1236]EEO10701.1 hypothetical protein VCC_001715 [Vibrio cholerae RC9]EEO17564.1 hypothetical protein VCE_001581 [Vibrio cholerae B33]EEO21236.1 hypothetical protein VCF_001179 [Vibrio cholerae BX 330286]CSC39001.1 Uncharacterised protein [Vibrio cholerae]
MSYTGLNSDFTTTKLHLADDSATVTPLVGRLIDTYATSQIDCSFARPRHFYCGGQ